MDSNANNGGSDAAANIFAAVAAQQVDEVDLGWQALVEARAAHNQAVATHQLAQRSGDMAQPQGSFAAAAKAAEAESKAHKDYKAAVAAAGGRRAQGDLQEEREKQARDLADSAPLLADTTEHAFAMFERRARGEEKPVPTPWPDLNNALSGGLWPGCYTVTGTTASGKSALGLQIGRCAASAGHPVLYVGLEFDKAQVLARLASQVLNDLKAMPPAPQPSPGLHTAPTWKPVPWSDIYLGKDPAAVALGRQVADPVLRQLPFRIEEAPPAGWPASKLVERMEALKAAHPTANGAPVIVVDFLQLIGPENEKDRSDLRERIGRAAAQAREAARKHGGVVLLLSSISRAGGGELAKKAIEGGLGPPNDPFELCGLGKESGDIEFSSDGVLALAREPCKDGSPLEMTWLAVAKGRAVKKSWLLLVFDETATFREATHEEKRPTPLEAAKRRDRETQPSRSRPKPITPLVPTVAADLKPGPFDDGDFNDAP